VRRPHSDRLAAVGVAAVQSAVANELGWVFREQTAHDFGIDAQVEVVEDGKVSGRLLGLQIKCRPSYFRESCDEGWWFRPGTDHVQYWLNHRLPVVVVLCDPGTRECYWQLVTRNTLRASSGENPKMLVPRSNVLDRDARGPLAEAAGRGGREAGARPLRVFVSHTSELGEFPRKGQSYIAAVREAVRACGHEFVEMGEFPAADLPPADLCEGLVRSCDVFVGVLGTRYGSLVRDRPELSYTELEFQAATEAGLTRLMLLLDPESADSGIPVGKLQDPVFGARQEIFRRRVTDGSDLTAQFFRSPRGLQKQVEGALQNPAVTFRADLALLLKAVDRGALEGGLPSFLPAGAGVLRMAREVRLVGAVRRAGAGAPNGREGAYELPAERGDRVGEPPVAWEQAAREHRRLVVLGDPGMGKSWLLRLEAHRLAAAALADPAGRHGEGGAPVPVLVRADVLAGQDGATLPEAVAGYLVGLGMLAERSRGRMRDLVASGGVALLVDALDEMPREAARAGGQVPRKRLEDLLRRWSENCPGARVVAASRLAGYTGPPVPGAREAELLPFTGDDARAAVQAWDLPAEAARWLEERLEDPAVAGLARVPLLLALTCSLAAGPGPRKGDLPGSRAALYESVVWQFLSGGHRAADHGAPGSALTHEERQGLLGVLTHVAFAFASTGRGWVDRMPRREVLDAISGAGDALADLEMSRAQVLERLAGTGILVHAGSPAEEEQDYMFLHRTVAEYLVARHLRDLPAESRMAAIAARQWFDPDWAEVFPLLGGLLAGSRPGEAGMLAAGFLSQRPDPLHYAFRTALRILGDIPDPGMLLDGSQEQALRDKTAALFTSSATRRMLASTLAAARTLPRAVTQALFHFLTDQDADVRAMAAWVLKRRDGDNVTSALINLLTSQDEDARRSAARALRRRNGDNIVTSDLVRLLASQDEDVRVAAALVLTGRDEAAILLQLANPASWSGRPTKMLECFNLASVIADQAYLRVPPPDRERVRHELDDLTRRV